MVHDICLNMIVKNEAHVIAQTLENLCKYIQFSYYVISDTGSTDNTIEVIHNFFNEKNIKGEIHNDIWKDFGHNRTVSLAEAYKKTKYLLIFDADDRINGDFKLPEVLDKDGYYFKFGASVTYKRILLINNHLKWIFVGVLHEYLQCTDKKSTTIELIDENYYVDSGKTGARSNDPDKYKKDALVLENAFYEAEKNNDHIKIRYSFYCAQSYRDSDNKEMSIKWYKKRAELKDWNQEVYYSYYMVGNLYAQLNEIEKAIYYWSLAIDADSERYETIYEIISHYRKLGNCKLAYYYFLMVENLNIDFTNKLFVSNIVYDYLLLYEMTIILSHVGKYEQGLEIYRKLFLIDTIPIILAYNILENLVFYIDHLKFDLEFNENYFNFVKKIHNVSKNYNDNHIKCINIVVNKMISLYDFNKINEIQKKLENKKYINVFFSITTCKRLDLFIKTMQSFLTCCKDIHLIDYFFCVDDNSSNEDRKNMLSNFPFIKYYFKTNEEKGHLTSMNIIWDKLNELKPKYWIHLEDDWCFIKPCNYVQKSIDFLKKYNGDNIHQVLFNKNYGEVISCYNLVGGQKLDDDFILHIKDEDIKYGRNCAYWSHYSFRPSMCIVDTIIKLGNYNCSGTFFEGEYAKKYFQYGYRSAYYNEICCLHTGKLTSERESNKKNAYLLNNINQFGVQKNIGFYINKNLSINLLKILVNYALFNQNILKNISYLICKNDLKDTFKNLNINFKIIFYDENNELENNIKLLNIDFVYFINLNNIIENDLNIILKYTKSIVHSFDKSKIYGDKNITFFGNNSYKNIEPLIDMNIVDNSNYRNELNILDNMYIFGCYDNLNILDIDYFHDVLINIVNTFKNVIFIFKNIHIFTTCDRIIFLNDELRYNDKNKFINTCNAIIYGKFRIADIDIKLYEFMNKKKPIIANIDDKKYIYYSNFISYDSFDELLNIFSNIENILNSKLESYKICNFSPTIIINKFNDIVYSNNCYKFVYYNKLFNDKNIILNSEYIENLSENNFYSKCVIKKLFNNDIFNNNKNIIFYILTHIKIWINLIFDKNYNNYIVTEYNLSKYIDNKIDENINFLIDNINDYDIILLNNSYNGLISDEIEINLESIDNILNYDLTLNKLDNYIITKKGAEKILNYINKNGIDELDLFKLFIKNKDLKISKNNNYLINFDSNIIENSIKLNSGDNYFDFNLYNLEEEYIFHKDLDHIGDDLCFNNNISINLSLLFCEYLNNCISFNTYGYFKHTTDKNNLLKINYNHENGGIYINIKKYDELYNIKKLEEFNDNVQIEYINNDIIIENVDENLNENLDENLNENVDENLDENVDKNVDENLNENVGENFDEDLNKNIHTIITNNLEKYISENLENLISKEDFNNIENNNIHDNIINLFNENKDNVLSNILIDSKNELDKIYNIESDKSSPNQDNTEFIEYLYENISIKNTPLIQFMGDYLFIENYDYSGNDIAYHPELNINELFNIAKSLNDCIAFNTNGYFKSNIDMVELNEMQYKNNNKIKKSGIYLKFKNFGGNNKYLKLNNINTSDKEYSINEIYNFNTYSDFINKNDDFIGFTNLGFIKNNINFHQIINIEKIYNNSLYINIDKYYNRIIETKNTIKIKLLCNWTSSENLCIELNKMSKGSLLWNNIEFSYDDNIIDYYVILNKPLDNDFYIPEKTIILRTKTFKKHQKNDYNFIRNIKYTDKNKLLYENVDEKCNNIFIWNFDLNYCFIKNNINLQKNMIDKIYTIFNFEHLEMEQFEAGLLKYFEVKYPSFIIDIYSNNNKYSFKNVIIENNIEKNNSLIENYKYCIIVEDFIENSFFEKIYNCIINETLCFYIGPENISNYFDSNSYVLLDRNNFEKSYQIIKNGIENNLWEEKIKYIRKEKLKILDYYNLFPTVERIIKEVV
jgi:hypothetical protein